MATAAAIIKKVWIGKAPFWRVTWPVPYGKDARTFPNRKEAADYANWLREWEA